MYKIETRKDKIKIIRTILESAVLLTLVFAIVRTLNVNSVYSPYDPQDKNVVSGEECGFLAMSYFGVDRQGTDTLISTKELDEQLKTLYDLGYVTISQADIEAYYQKKQPLPDKALFLMFEDGRRDTMLFSEKILEKYNYKATILSYADKFAEKDPKFLSAKDLKKLQDNSYWELGTNGYRLSYINSYDRYDRFLGQMTSDEFVRVNQYLGRDYNHYLMDYIRDENRIPVESDKAMESRITQDYHFMEQIYSEEVGTVPELYCLMHSNTGRYGNTTSVSQVNEDNIEDLFEMNFNRDGYALNTVKSSIYDLTRLQPQAYWSTNHLLMRVKAELPENQKQKIVFVTGKTKRDKERAGKWFLKSGADEFKKDSLVVTSEPQGEGLVSLKNVSVENAEISVKLQGNKIGGQTIYLRDSEDHSRYIAVSVQNNHLILSEKGANSTSTTMMDKDLHDLVDVSDRISMEEDKKDSLVAEYKMRGRFADSAADSLVFYREAGEAGKVKTRSVADGADEYIPELQINDLGDTDLKIRLEGEKLQVWVNGTDVTGTIKVSVSGAGMVRLGASWGGFGYSQRNVADDVYDGVFSKLLITDGDKTVYDGRLPEVEKLADALNDKWNAVVNWFIKNL